MTSALPLEGLRVLELGHIIAGPSAGLLLADRQRWCGPRDRRRVAGFHVADDRLAAFMHHDALDVDNLLTTLATLAVQCR